MSISSASDSAAAGAGGSSGAVDSNGMGAFDEAGVSSGTGAAGTNGDGGVGFGGTGGSGGGGASMGSARSNLPIPPGGSAMVKPAGSAADLKVLPWAGFKAAVTYTLDDAQPSQIDHWPEIKATGVPVTYYITTSNNGYAGYDATWQMAFAAGDELGNHTVNHCRPDLSGCAKPYGAASKSLGTAGAEIDQATDYIAAKLGTRGVWTMAYPYGDTGYKSLARERFFLARGVGGGTVGPGDNTDPYNLPCFVAKGGESPGAFNALVDSARAQGKWLTFLFHTLLPDAQNWFAGVDIGSVTGSMSYAKALPDVWLGTLVDVGAYWLGQKTLQAVVSGPVSARTTWTWSLPAHFPPGKFLRVTVGGGSLEQGTRTLPWDGHGYYEVALDASSLTWTP